MLQQTGVKQIQDAVVVLHKMSADEKTRELAEMINNTKSPYF